MSLLSRRCVVFLLLCLLAVARCTEDTPPGWSSPSTPFVTSIHGDGPPVNTWGGNASVSTLAFVSLQSYPGALCNGEDNVFSELAAARYIAHACSQTGHLPPTTGHQAAGAECVHMAGTALRRAPPFI